MIGYIAGRMVYDGLLKGTGAGIGSLLAMLVGAVVFLGAPYGLYISISEGRGIVPIVFFAMLTVSLIGWIIVISLVVILTLQSGSQARYMEYLESLPRHDWQVGEACPYCGVADSQDYALVPNFGFGVSCDCGAEFTAYDYTTSEVIRSEGL